MFERIEIAFEIGYRVLHRVVIIDAESASDIDIIDRREAILHLSLSEDWDDTATEESERLVGKYLAADMEMESTHIYGRE